MTYDIVVRGGTVVDGSGAPSYRADVGVAQGVIAAIGDLRGQAATDVIDADGQVVSPGFVDGHTHMDAQIFWDPLGTCSCWHGVTSVVMGNCGFSLAPCAEKDKALVMRNLERAEDISRAAMEAGIPWSWERFPEYLDTVEQLPKGINYASYIGHSALRTWAMGERAFEETANQADMAKMKDELAASLRAGAVGFSTSRSGNHRTPEGRPVASRVAAWDEVRELAGVMRDLKTGVFELSREDIEHDAEKRHDYFARIKSLAVETGVPVTFGNTWYHRRTPDVWHEHVDMVDDIAAAGGKVLIQGCATWNGSLRSFETMTPFDKAPAWQEFRKQSLADQEADLRNSDTRRTLLEALRDYRLVKTAVDHNQLRPVDWNWVFPMVSPLPPYRSIAQIASADGKDPLDVMIDMALERHLKLFFITPTNNENQDIVLSMLRHPLAAVTFSDSGAHVASTVNPVQTHLLGYWVRDRGAISLESAVRKITSDVAGFWGLRGRGLLREGYAADLAVFDPDSIAPAMPELVRDLPTGASRILQKATGIQTTIVNGQVLMRDGEHVGGYPGRLLRSGR